jgi:hypothetical protein
MDWAKQLGELTGGRTKAHLMVACELIIGGINAAEHLARFNIGEIARDERRSRYLDRLTTLMKECRYQYQQVQEHL